MAGQAGWRREGRAATQSAASVFSLTPVAPSVQLSWHADLGGPGGGGRRELHRPGAADHADGERPGGAGAGGADLMH